MLFTYTYFKLLRYGVVPETMDRFKINYEDTIHRFSYLIQLGDEKYIINDNGLNELDLDQSCLIYTYVLTHFCSKNSTTKNIIKKLKFALLNEGIEPVFAVPVYDNGLFIEVFDANAIETPVLSYFIGSVPDDVREYLSSYSEYDYDKPAYDEPTIEVYTEKMKKIAKKNFKDVKVQRM